MTINNDKNNELTKTIISIAQSRIQSGNVVGIYISCYKNEQNNNQTQIEVTTVVNEDASFDLAKEHNQNSNKSIYTRVRNIIVKDYIEFEWRFSSTYMHWREKTLAQELKNAIIIYDKDGFLESYKQTYDKDESLKTYTNRVEISPKLIEKIKHGINSEINMQIPNTLTTHLVNLLARTSHNIIQQIELLLYQYDFETNEVYSPTYYIICNDENLEQFKVIHQQMKDNYRRYDVRYALDSMLTTNDSNSSLHTIKRPKFYQQCLQYLEEELHFINVVDYLDDELIEIYYRLKKDSKLKRK